MNPQKEKAITHIINQNKTQGINFAQTKQQLLSQGYTEADIVYALYSDPYDSSGVARKPNPLQKYYEQCPEAAQKIAVDLLTSKSLTSHATPKILTSWATPYLTAAS